MEENKEAEVKPAEPDINALLDAKIVDIEKSLKNSILDYVKTLHEENIKIDKMDDTEKVNYEFEQRQKELDERERELEKKALKQKGIELLQNRNLDKELVNVLPLTNEETLTKGVDMLEKSINSMVQNAINERLKGETPKIANNGNTDEKSAIKNKLLGIMRGGK